MKLLKLKKINETDLYVIVETTHKSFFGKIKNRKVVFDLKAPVLSIYMDSGESIEVSLKDRIKAFLLMDLEEFIV